MSLSLSKAGVGRNISLFIWIFVCLFLFSQRFISKKWKPGENTGTIQLSYDSFGYYLYLPSTFIYHDFSQLNYLKEILPKYKPTTDFSQAIEGPSGKYVNKYTIGQALMFAPFFITAHYIIAPLTGYEMDGFSVPYQASIGFGCLIYTFIGLFVLRKILLSLFTDITTSIVLLSIALGTNFLLYATADNTLPHNQLFFIFTLIVYFTIRYYEKPTTISAIIIGFLIGLATLIRPSEVIICLIPLFWGVIRVKDLTDRITNHWKRILLMAFTALVVVSWQLLYWKFQSGRFFFYSYGNEQLNLWKPHLSDVLFSFRKGWFIYTPVMIFAVIGMVSLWKYFRMTFWPVFLFMLMNIWIVSSWDCWWYGGCFGQRAMVQSYAILALPFGAFIFTVSKSKWVLLKLSALIALFGFVILNVFQVWQYRKGYIHYESMTKEAYFSVFGKTHLPDNFQSLLKEPDYSHYGVQKGIEFQDFVLVDEQFDNGFAGAKNDVAFEGGYSFWSDPVSQFGPTYSFPISTLPCHPEVKVKCAFKLFSRTKIIGSNLVITVEHSGEPAYIYKSLNLGFMQFPVNTWNQVEMWVDIPKYVAPDDLMKVYIWNTNDNQIYIDNFVITLQKKIYI